MRRATRPGAPRALILAGLVALVGLLGACDGSTSAATLPADPSAVVASLGAVPIPSAVPAESTPSASVGHPALLAMGGPVAVSLPDGTRALVTALGPRMDAPPPPPGGSLCAHCAVSLPTETITLRLAVTRGTLGADAAQLSSRDDTGRAVPLTAVGPARVSASAGRTARLTVRGVYRSGAAQLTWRHDGHVLGVWTFNIEMD